MVVGEIQRFYFIGIENRQSCVLKMYHIVGNHVIHNKKRPQQDGVRSSPLSQVYHKALDHSMRLITQQFLQFLPPTNQPFQRPFKKLEAGINTTHFESLTKTGFHSNRQFSSLFFWFRSFPSFSWTKTPLSTLMLESSGADVSTSLAIGSSSTWS